ncbi:pheromone-binding protein Gp-9-like [Cataglyphis hispanica]|uniref:pheromone-binding protein Gp-9-like n=1 Tax=Cataglyphis hispanica TaxID=1086592 RepID=UPI00217F5FDC|nr:pheromone-binding protein Gp-9-like [Cataglyphis hispanica]
MYSCGYKYSTKLCIIKQNNLNKMKLLVLCICVLGFATSDLANNEIKQQFKSAMTEVEDDMVACMTENNVTESDWYRVEEIMTGVHTEPENEEKTRKLGCTVVCLLKKENLMEGSNIKEERFHAKINKEAAGSPYEGKMHKIARNCMKEVKDITEVCEKGFALFSCFVKATHKLQHHEEHETITTDQNEEAE